jgi:hypothetical protein
MTTYTDRFRLALQVFRDRNWHTALNTTLGLVDAALGQVQSIDLTAGDVTLTASNNADDQSRAPVTLLTGTPGAARTVTVPDVERAWLFENQTDGTVTLTTGSGDTVVMPSGDKAIVYTDGATNVEAIFDAARNVGILVTSTLDSGLTVGEGKAFFRVPAALDGYRLHAVKGSLFTTSASGTVSFGVRNVTDGVEMLGSNGTFPAGTVESADAVVDTAHDDVAEGDRIAIDLDAAGTTAVGLFVNLLFYPGV